MLDKAVPKFEVKDINAAVAVEMLSKQLGIHVPMTDIKYPMQLPEISVSLSEAKGRNVLDAIAKAAGNRTWEYRYPCIGKECRRHLSSKPFLLLH